MNNIIKIIIVGNGFGGIYTLKNLHKFLCGNKNIEITLIGEKNYFLFTPLLHEVATGGINKENIVEPIRKILGCCLSDFYLGKVDKINLNDKTVQVEDNILSYDYLVLAPGAETNFYNIEGAKENSLTLKSIEDAIKIKNHIINKIEHASHAKDMERRKKMLTFSVIGGGPTGVELVAELQELIKESFATYYKKDLIEDSSVLLIQKGPELLPQFQIKMRQKSLETLVKKGVKVMLNSEAKEIGHNYILVNDKKIETETIIYVAGIKPTNLEFDKEIEKIQDGRLLVNKYLQLEKHNNVFALGDNVAFKTENGFLPALAQVAEKQANTVAQNIFLTTKNKGLKPFTYKHRGTLVSLGQWMAVGEISNFTFYGHLTWWLWRTIYLSKLISFRKKIKVAIDWTINLFSPRDISEL